jgi:hypothetical protein
MPDNDLIQVPLILVRRAAKTDRNFKRILAAYHNSKSEQKEIPQIEKEEQPIKKGKKK